MGENETVREVFIAALACNTPEARGRYLDEACRDQPEVRRRVEGLLRLHEQAGDFLESAVGSVRGSDLVVASNTIRPDAVTAEQPGDKIGHYKLLQQIGEGGCGAVYMAEQQEPIRRRVAFKVIKLGMDTKQVIARFEVERQALALMDHPNIARVLDAGATETGRPYFVMELVRGQRITEYCDENNLSTEQRLNLFIRVCHAIQHAHQKGVIHRDIKPSNILVTVVDGQAVPKVIDFGIAKAIGQQLTEKTVFTAFEQFIGTPAYMSPEQAQLSGVDVDTRSDIYSLGVLLYELLTSHTPFDPKTLVSAGLDEMRRIIREQEPPRPSTRLSTLEAAEQTTVAKCRQSEPPKLIHQVRGDLDWIVMKCLEKERGRRYETANSLAQDLERHLTNEPVSASPPGRLYRLQKLVRRNKLVFAAGTSVALAVVLGTAFSVWQAVRASRALDELRRTAPALAEQARALVAQERFDEAIERLDYAAKLRPDSADYLVAKANLLQANLKLAEACQIYRRALKLQPSHTQATANAELCERLLTAKPDAQGRLTRESLAELHVAMQKQNRPAAELLPVARLLGKEKQVLLQTWLARLQELPIPPDKPLKERLTMRDDGLLVLDLKDTKLTSLEMLAGAPLGSLALSNVAGISELTPLRGMRLSELDLEGTTVKDLSPLSGMSSLRRLKMGRTRVADLSPLAGLPLVHLALESTPVTDLRPLKGMPLEELFISGTHVTSLSALTEAPLKWLEAHMVPVLDFAPLTGRPLQRLCLLSSRVRDLGFVRGMPLKILALGDCQEVRNLRVLSQIPTLESLLLPSDYWLYPGEELEAIAALKTHPGLKQLGAEYMKGTAADTLQAKELFWKRWDAEQPFIAGLGALGIKPDLTRLDDGTYWLSLRGATLTNVPPIPKDFPLSELSLQDTKVRELSPLRGLRLRKLVLNGTFVQDLHPLEGLPLEWLYLGGRNTTVTDLTPLRGLPLKGLCASELRGAPDVSPLAAVPTLEYLALPRLARNIEALRKHPNIKRLSFKYDLTLDQPAQSVEEFWRDWDVEKRIAGPLRAFGTNSSLTKLDDGTYSLDCSGFSATNLPSIPRDLPISQLFLRNSQVRDLNGLRGLRLRCLSIVGSPVEDLGPLEGMPLEWLSLGLGVTNLAPIGALPLKALYAHTVRGTPDVSLLAAIPTLEQVTLPRQARNVEALRTHPRIKRLSFKHDQAHNQPAQTVEEFWKEWALREVTVTSVSKPTASDPQAGGNLVDLSLFYNANLKENWHGGSTNDTLALVPTGIQTLGGTDFDIGGLVQLDGGRLAGRGKQYPASVAGIPVRRKFARLHVLHATNFSEANDARIGAFVLHYADGRQAELPILFGQDVQDWWHKKELAGAAVTRATVAWTGSDSSTNIPGVKYRLFKRTWDNPRPEAEVESIDFTSTVTDCAPFLLAITLE